MSISRILFNPCLPFTKPLWSSWAYVRMPCVMMLFITPAHDLLSAFFMLRGLVSWGERTTLRRSASLEPLAGRAMKESLKLGGAGLPRHILTVTNKSVRIAIVPAFSHARYGIPSGPVAENRASFRNLPKSSSEGAGARETSI